MDISKNPCFLCILGPPGSGKGTLCSKLSKDFGYFHFSVGDYMREMSRNSTFEEDEGAIREHLQKGKLLPTKMITPILHRKITDEVKNSNRLFLIDGFPRKIDQAFEFERQIGVPALVISFNCPKEIAKQRFLSRKLPDRQHDDDVMFEKRFAEFERENGEIVQYYRSQGKLEELDSSSKTEVTYSRLLKALDKRMKAKTRAEVQKREHFTSPVPSIQTVLTTQIYRTVKRMQYSYSWIALTSMLGVGLAHNIHLGAHGRECFHEQLHKDDKMTVTFQVGDREFGGAGSLDIDFWIQGPTNIFNFLERGVSSGDHSFDAQADGKYTYCFSNEHSSSGLKEVSFNVHGIVYVPESEMAADPLETEVKALFQLVSQVKDEQQYIVMRERTHRNTAESTNARVKWWSIFQLGVLLGEGVFQVWWLKRFFEVKRVV